MALKIANTAVVDDSGNFVGDFGGLVVNNRLVFDDTRCFQGVLSGYTSGGTTPAGNTIDKFPFSADSPATDVGDLTSCACNASAGISSFTHGYVAGGGVGASGGNRIDKFPFSSDTNATEVGELILGIGDGSYTTYGIAGTSSADNGTGFTHGGFGSTWPGFHKDAIQCFPFASDTDATDNGELSVKVSYLSGQSSATNGYRAGGRGDCTNYTKQDTIEKYPFSATVTASDVGELSNCRAFVTGQSSSTNGYVSGGAVPPNPANPKINTISKFPFASDTSATDVACLTVAKDKGAGQSSVTNGYFSGGADPSAYTDNIEKFTFSSDTNSTDVAELSVARECVSGQQV